MNRAGAVSMAAFLPMGNLTMYLEFVGCVSGVAGTMYAALLGEGGSLFPTFIVYAMSNTVLVWAAIRRNAKWLLVMNACYGFTTVVGLINHFPST